MPAWMDVVLFNAISTTILAVLVALVALRMRRPAVVHTLWLLVLLKLVTPPIFEVGMLPRWERAARDAVGRQLSIADPVDRSERSGEPASSVASIAPEFVSRDGSGSADPSTSTFGAPRSALALLPFVAAAGTLLVLGVTIVDLVRFRHRLRHAPDAPRTVQERAAQLARTVGIRRLPRIRIVDGIIPPSLWPGLFVCELLVPAGLLERLDDEERDALLAHELAHLKRRDHWLRPLELLIVALYWWHPVAWWARRNMRVAEELACDAMATRWLGDRPRVYAESLLKTIEFLAGPERAVPVLATGIAGAARLKERITMIMKQKSPEPLSLWLRSGLYAVVLLILVVSPAWVEKASSAGEQTKPEAEHQRQMLAMQEEEMRVHQEMQRLEQDLARVRLNISEKKMQEQLQTMRQELASLETDGKKAEAEELRRRIANAEQEAASHRKSVEADLAQTEKRQEVERQMQELAMQMQKAEMAGDLETLQKLQEQVYELQRAQRSVELETLQAELARQRELLEREQKELKELNH